MSPRPFSRSRISRKRCLRATSRTGPPDAFLKRRNFLLGGAALAGAAALAAWRFWPGTGTFYWPDQGFWNPCLAGLPRHLSRHELVKAAWEGLDPARVWDCHTHLVGTGDSSSGIVINPRMNSALNPAHYARRLFFLNAGCAYDVEGGSVDRAYVRRMLNLIDGMRRGAKPPPVALDPRPGRRRRPPPGRPPFSRPPRRRARARAGESARLRMGRLDPSLSNRLRRG